MPPKGWKKPVTTEADHLPWEDPSNMGTDTPVAVVDPETGEEPPMKYDDLDPRNNEDDGVIEPVFAEVIEEGPVPETGLTTIVTIPDQQHLVVGVGALAAMDEASFQRNIAQLIAGQERLAILTDKLLVHGQDYGRVPGISKPFLQKPGAEKLGMFYGLALRFEADRLVGDGVLAPQLAYHVRAYAHLGSFDGPVVAQGFGESNSWEERYRYRTATPTCPTCGREGLIKRKSPPNLAGKWNCPSWQDKGGCNAVFEPNDERISNLGKVENTDPWGLANTLIKMAEKRAQVDVILRATGTSGFFSQDEDSASVRQQAGDAPFESNDDKKPKIENVTNVKAEAGGKEATASVVQLRELVALSKEHDLGPSGISALMKRVLGKAVGETQAAVSTAAKALTGDEIGKLLLAIRTGEVPSEEPDAGFPPQQSDEM